MEDDLRRAVGTKLEWQRYMAVQGDRFGRELPAEGSGLELHAGSPEHEAYYKTQRMAFAGPIFYGDLLSVGVSSCGVLQGVVDSLDQDVTLEASWFPFPVGFVYFQRELELPQLLASDPQSRRPLAFRALGWSCLKPERGRFVTSKDLIATKVVLWATMIELGRSTFLPLSFLTWKVGQSLNECIAVKDAADEPWEHYRDSRRHELRYAAAFLVLTQSADQKTLTLNWDSAARDMSGGQPLRPPNSITSLVFQHRH